jgi:hypothetical protein
MLTARPFLGCWPRQLLLQGEGRQHRPARVVFVRHRGTEQGDETINSILDDAAPIALHRGLSACQERLHKAMHRFGTEPCGQGGGLDQATAQDGDLLVLLVWGVQCDTCERLLQGKRRAEQLVHCRGRRKSNAHGLRLELCDSTGDAEYRGLRRTARQCVLVLFDGGHKPIPPTMEGLDAVLRLSAIPHRFTHCHQARI